MVGRGKNSYQANICCEDTFIIISVIKNMKIIVFYQLLSDKSTVGELYSEMIPAESDQSRKILNKCYTIMFSFKKCSKPNCGKFLCKATIEMLTCLCFMGWDSIILKPLWHKKTKRKSSEISHLLCCLKKTEMNKEREKSRIKIQAKYFTKSY